MPRQGGGKSKARSIDAEVVDRITRKALAKAEKRRPVLVDHAEGDSEWEWRRFLSEFSLSQASGTGRFQNYSLWALGELQGLMTLEVSGSSHRTRRRKLPQVYVEYLSVAPDNRPSVRSPRKILGCGSALLGAAFRVSRRRGWEGRVGLHSLPGALGFYKGHGFVDRGPDPGEQGLNYMEFGGKLQERKVMGYDKMLSEWVRRGIELEKQGLGPGVIGSSARMERLKARNRKTRFYQDLVIRAGKNELKIAIVDPPEVAGNRVALGIVLDLPLHAEGRKVSGNKASSAFVAFVRDAVAESLKRHHGRARRRSNGIRRVKPA